MTSLPPVGLKPNNIPSCFTTTLSLSVSLTHTQHPHACVHCTHTRTHKHLTINTDKPESRGKANHRRQGEQTEVAEARDSLKRNKLQQTNIKSQTAWNLSHRWQRVGKTACHSSKAVVAEKKRSHNCPLGVTDRLSWAIWLLLTNTP